MFTDKELADALVEAGILTKDEWDNYELDNLTLWAGEIITDWRVAGKVLESMGKQKIAQHCYVHDTDWLVDPRAIVEAWFAALETK